MSTKQIRDTELLPSDFHRRPIIDEELATWQAMTPEQRALFDNMLGATFQWVLHVQGARFQEWVEVAARLGCIRPTYRRHERAG